MLGATGYVRSVGHESLRPGWSRMRESSRSVSVGLLLGLLRVALGLPLVETASPPPDCNQSSSSRPCFGHPDVREWLRTPARLMLLLPWCASFSGGTAQQKPTPLPTTGGATDGHAACALC